jgi:hypothetical protein
MQKILNLQSSRQSVSWLSATYSLRFEISFSLSLSFLCSFFASVVANIRKRFPEAKAYDYHPGG